MDDFGFVLALMAGLLVVSALFSSAETAVFCLGPADLRKLKGRHRRAGVALDALMADRRKLLVTILLANLTVNVLYFNLGALVTTRLEAQAGMGALVPPLVLAAVILFGEMVPKTLAVHHPEKVAVLVARPLLWIERLLVVPRAILASVAVVLSRLVMGTREEEGELGSEELEGLLQVAVDRGHLGVDEFTWLQSLLDLSSTPVRETMVPRVELSTFRLPAQRTDFLALAADKHRNRIPVFAETVDRLDGYLDVREVMASPEAELEALVRPLVFVPETATVATVADQMMQENLPLVIVVDEYGGTEGLVTREDLVEAVVGDLADEVDDEQPPVVTLGEGRFDVDARLGVQAWRRIFRHSIAGLPVGTIGGVVTALLGRLPKVGDEVRSGSLRFRVASLRGRRLHRIEITVQGGEGAS